MSQRVVYTCDRCARPGAFHLELSFYEYGTPRTLDLCVPCGAEALRQATERMGPPAKLDWLDDLLTPPDPPDQPAAD